ncbi:MAG: HNH endonuclease [Chitinophagaceae bacterium]|nr:MAG: HNH endonuclease [Chitinophagaceae bacterium]
MAFWWVNHKQTAKHEIEGGFIWSPTTNKDGSRNQTYINLTRADRFDIVFSFANATIGAIGVVRSPSIPSQRPPEFGKTGQQWSRQGWLVAIEWHVLKVPIVPKDHIQQIKDFLPKLNSPIRQNGNGNQGCYLAEIDDDLGNLLVALIRERQFAVDASLDDLMSEVEEQTQIDDVQATSVDPTSKEQLIKARVGQGVFRSRVEAIEEKCRITGVSDRRFLIASHIKPWRASNDNEKLDGSNGFLLSPHVDKLYDKGYISFSDSGELLIAHKDVERLLDLWKIHPNVHVGKFSDKQKAYLAYHRLNIFKRKSELLNNVSNNTEALNSIQ